MLSFLFFSFLFFSIFKMTCYETRGRYFLLFANHLRGKREEMVDKCKKMGQKRFSRKRFLTCLNFGPGNHKWSCSVTFYLWHAKNLASRYFKNFPPFALIRCEEREKGPQHDLRVSLKSWVSWAFFFSWRKIVSSRKFTLYPFL